MTRVYEKPQLTVHGRVEELTQNTGLTADTDFIIVSGNPNPPDGIDGSRDFTINDGGGGGFQ